MAASELDYDAVNLFKIVISWGEEGEVSPSSVACNICNPLNVPFVTFHNRDIGISPVVAVKKRFPRTL